MFTLSFYRYQIEDGNSLSFTYDSVNLGSCLDDEINALDLDEGSSAWTWIEQNDVEAFRNIRSLNITLPITEGGLKNLERIAAVNPDPGLYISGNGPIEDILKLFTPEWIFAEEYGIVDEKEGLFQQVMYYDQDGILWLGTDKGLVKIVVKKNR